MLLKSVQAECTANVSKKCVPCARTSDRECMIAHPRPRPRDAKGEAVDDVDERCDRPDVADVSVTRLVM